MDALAMDPDGYSGTYKLVGGRPSLDLVNTVSWPGTERRHDWLSSGANVERWFEAVGLSGGRVAAGDLDEVRRVRDVVAGVVGPLAHGDHPPVVAVDELNRRLGPAVGARLLDPQTLRWSWRAPETVADALAPVLFDSAELVAVGPDDRLRHCPSCDWLFEDRSRNGRRRWCDMADCGSRAKARDYYHRTKRSAS